MRPAKRACIVRRCCLCCHSVALCSFTTARLRICGREWGARAPLPACLCRRIPGPPVRSHPLCCPQHVPLQTGLEHESRCLPGTLPQAASASRGCLTPAEYPERSPSPLSVLGPQKAAGTRLGSPPWGRPRKSARRNRGVRATGAPSHHKHPATLLAAVPSPGPIKSYFVTNARPPAAGPTWAPQALLSPSSP